MGAISVRVPDALEDRLNREANLSGKPRSEIVREAIADLVARRERERFMREYVAEARAGYAEASLRREARAIAEEAVALDNEALEQAEAAGPSPGSVPNPIGEHPIQEHPIQEKWWR